YKGIVLATLDVASGQVDLMFDGLSVALPQIEGGKRRSLAVRSRDRVPSLPGVPTMQEAGFKDFDVSAWFALLAPAGLPPEILVRLEKATNEIMRTPETIACVGKLGTVAKPKTSRAFAQFIREANECRVMVVKASDVRLD